METAIETALADVEVRQIHGQQVTPFLLTRVNQLTDGASLQVNLALLRNNAQLGASISRSLVAAG
jgi:pseudouridine-5'-phosphate glycosidase